MWGRGWLQVDKLCEIECNNFSLKVCSVCWQPRQNFLAVGAKRGFLHIYDTATQQRVRSPKS